MADQNGEGYLQRDFRFGATKGILEFFWDILVCHSSYNKNKNKTKKMFKTKIYQMFDALAWGR